MLTKNFQMKGVLTRHSINCTFEGTYRRHLDANVSICVYGKHFDQHFLNKRDGRGTRENPLQVEHYFPCDTESSLDDVELSLGIGGETKQKGKQRKIHHQNFTSSSSSPEIIDLEESNCSEMSGDIKPIFELGCIAGSADSRDLHGYRSICFSVNHENKDVSRGVSLSFADECKTHQEHISINEGLELFKASAVATLESGNCMHMARKQIEKSPDVGISPVTKVFTSHEALFLDLNNPLPDESGHCMRMGRKQIEELADMGISPVTKVFTSHEALFLDLNNPPPDALSDPKASLDYSGGGCSGVTERVGVNSYKGLSPDGTSCSLHESNCLDEVSAINQQDTLNSKTIASKSNSNSTSSRIDKALSPGTELISRPSDCCYSHHYLLANSHHEDADHLDSNLTGRSDTGQIGAGLNDEIINDKNAVSNHLCCRVDPVENLNSSPVSWNSAIMTIDRSCSLKTMESGTYNGKSDPPLMKSSPHSELSHHEASSGNESKSESFDETENVSAPDDFLVRRGAISLVYLFLESSREEHSRITKFDEVVNGNGDGKRDQPQHSIDTFESMVLKQEEYNSEDYCVTSNPPEVFTSDNKDFGVKTRRGRRMKDFKKDILPSLASLSRHEISEDIRTLNGAMRSREYKRLQSKKCSEQKCFTPVKSKRSRFNYVGRKYCS